MKRLVLVGFILSIFLSVPAFAADQKIWLESAANEKPLVDLNLPNFVPVVEKLGKAVVSITVEGNEPEKEIVLGGGSKAPFDFLFKAPGSKKKTFQSFGSGFVVHPDGYIITNNHVVEKANKITISFKDNKKEYEAKVIGLDKKTDIALLKVDIDKKLPSAVLGDSKALKPGEWVIAMGSPFRLGDTATVGIISAVSRKVGSAYVDFIQTDASINLGNSGGPLFNAKGEVVGVNTAIVSPGGGSVGIGFAIPVNEVKEIVSELHDKGEVTRAWLGVLIQPVSEDVAEALDLPAAHGALVADVVPDSPAKKAGIQRRDIVISFNGKKILEHNELPRLVAKTKVGTTAAVRVIRGKKKKNIKVKLEKLKNMSIAAKEVEKQEEILGITVQDLTPDLAAGLGLDDASGVLVSFVGADTPAEKSGIKRGDVILEFDSAPIRNLKDFNKAATKLKKNRPALMLVKRGDNTIFLTLKLE